jgi:hypothetical protein
MCTCFCTPYSHRNKNRTHLPHQAAARGEQRGREVRGRRVRDERGQQRPRARRHQRRAVEPRGSRGALQQPRQRLHHLRMLGLGLLTT